MTQEELAQVLHVSRTAISKWESGRGYPSIDSLKAIAAFFSVSVDVLLSGDEMLTAAAEETRKSPRKPHDLLFGLLDLSAVLLWFLPLLGQRTAGGVQEGSLWMLAGLAAYLRIAYFAVTACMIGLGILMLALQNSRNAFWLNNKIGASFALNAAGVLLFAVSLQPYAAVLLFSILMIKALTLIKTR